MRALLVSVELLLGLARTEAACRSPEVRAVVPALAREAEAAARAPAPRGRVRARRLWDEEADRLSGMGRVGTCVARSAQHRLHLRYDGARSTDLALGRLAEYLAARRGARLRDVTGLPWSSLPPSQ